MAPDITRQHCCLPSPTPLASSVPYLWVCYAQISKSDGEILTQCVKVMHSFVVFWFFLHTKVRMGLIKQADVELQYPCGKTRKKMIRETG